VSTAKTDPHTAQIQATLKAMAAQATAAPWVALRSGTVGGSITSLANATQATGLASQRYDLGPTVAPVLVTTGALGQRVVVPSPLPKESRDDYYDRVVGGSWGPSHGGFNLFDPTTWGNGFQDAANAMGIIASAFGLVGASQWVVTLQALAGNATPQSIGAAIAADYRNFDSAEAFANAVDQGDWDKLYHLAVTNATELEQLKSAFAANNTPMPAPPASAATPLAKGAAAATKPATKGKTVPTDSVTFVTVPTSAVAKFGAALAQPPIILASAVNPKPAAPSTLAPSTTPAAASTPWYKKTLFSVGKTPVTTGEVGLGGVIVAVGAYVLDRLL
jgi:hypothetical protein